MRVHQYFSVLLTLGIFLTTNSLEARLVETWSYEELVKAADLVAIVEPISNHDNSDSVRLQGLSAQEVSTTFRILACLKGQASKEIVLRHFVFKNAIPPAGSPVNFLIGPIKLKAILEQNGKSAERDMGEVMPRWLVFLKASPDGSYAPATGQLDSGPSYVELHERSSYGSFLFGTRFPGRL